MKSKICKLDLLKQFHGLYCEVSFHTCSDNNNLFCNHIYNCFDFNISNDKLSLFDSLDETINIWLDNELILEVSHLTDDLYDDVISIYTKDFILSVTTLETRPFKEV